MNCTLIVHELYTNCTLFFLTVHFLYTNCTLIVHYFSRLYTFCTRIVHKLYTLFSDCTFFVHALYINCTLFFAVKCTVWNVQPGTVQCTDQVTKNSTMYKRICWISRQCTSLYRNLCAFLYIPKCKKMYCCTQIVHLLYTKKWGCTLSVHKMYTFCT